MIPKSPLPYAMLIAALVAAPSVFARVMHEVTGDPLWRWLAIEEQDIVASLNDFEATGPFVHVRITWKGPDATYETPHALATDVRRAFETKGIASYILVEEDQKSDGSDRTTIEVKAGSSTFGPFLVRSAASHIQPAAAAARLSYRPNATEEHRW
ncbi:MAG: hypothetical protein AAGB05_07220 [Pseudomonadota bacterium]